jgi:pimeloyl-ACP methyl ester carboxylesterase
MPFALINDHRIYYEDTGGTAPAVVFSHGFVLDRTMWAPQVAALSDRYRCIVWDERGHGMTECRGAFDFWDSARDCLGLLNHLQIDSAVLVGMSQGGFLSLRAALTAPDKVAGLVIISSATHLFTPEEYEGYKQMAAGWTTLGPQGELAEAMRGIQFGPDFDWLPWLGKWQSKPPSDWTHSWQSQIDRDDIGGRLAEITCPVGFIHGADDPAFPLSTAHEMSNAIPSSLGVVAIAGAAHGAVLTHPDETTDALTQFLDKMPR